MIRNFPAARVLAAASALLALRPSASAHEPGETEEAAPLRTAPVLLERVSPIYPEGARRQGLGGTVTLEIAIGADGAVAGVKVVRGAGFGFDEASVAAAQRFKFKPATDGGKPIASTVLFNQGFTIQPRFAAQTDAAGEPPPSAPAATEAPASTAPAYRSTVIDRGPTSAASATTVRNLDFDLRPRSSPNDLLRVVPGLLAVQHQGGGKADQLFLRGFDADHGTDVAVFVDGVPINLPSHAHGQGFADLHWIIPEAMDRIDVVKGPYDARFGDFATAGAVNLITRTEMPESSAQLTLGSFPTRGCKHLDANFTGSANDCPAFSSQRFVAIAAPHFSGWAERLHAWLAFEAAHDDGPFDNPEHLRRYNLFAKLTHDLSPATHIGLFFQAYGSAWTGSGQIPEREVTAGRLSPFGALDPSEGGLTERQMITAFLHHKSADNEWNATLYLARYQLSLWNDFTFFLRDPTNGDEIEQDDARVYAGLRADYHFHRSAWGVSFRTTAGVEARYDGVHVDRWDAESCGSNGAAPADCPGGDLRKRLWRQGESQPPGANGNTDHIGNNDDVSQVNVAAFLEEDVVFNHWLRAIAALRADYFGFRVNDQSEQLGAGSPNTSGVAQKALLSPKATLVFTPIARTLDLYVNFGEGFHTNPAQVAIADGRRVSVPNADGSTSTFTAHAVPRFYGGELGARVHLWNRVEAAAAFWLSYLENETVFDADVGAFVPSEPSRRLGVDLELRVRILDWLHADFDLAQASATSMPDSGIGGAIALAPRLYMTGGLTVKHPIGVRAGLRFRYLGPRPAFDETSPEYQYFTSKTLPSGAPNPDYDPSRVQADGYVVFDAYVGWRWRHIEVALAAQNLFNSSWREAQFGNRSCTRDETFNQANPYYAGSGNTLADGTYVNRCGVTYGSQRSGVVDVHYTPGVPLQLMLTLKAVL